MGITIHALITKPNVLIIDMVSSWDLANALMNEFLWNFFIAYSITAMGYHGSSVVKNLLPNAVDVGSIPGSRRAPVERNGYPLQYSSLGN